VLSCTLVRVLFSCFRYDRTHWATVMHSVLCSTWWFWSRNYSQIVKSIQRQFYECRSYLRVTISLSLSTICSLWIVDSLPLRNLLSTGIRPFFKRFDIIKRVIKICAKLIKLSLQFMNNFGFRTVVLDPMVPRIRVLLKTDYTIISIAWRARRYLPSRYSRTFMVSALGPNVRDLMSSIVTILL